MEEKKNFEAIFKEDLYQYLLSIDKVDAHLPEAPDLEELWQKVGDPMNPIRQTPTAMTPRRRKAALLPLTAILLLTRPRTRTMLRGI